MRVPRKLVEEEARCHTDYLHLEEGYGGCTVTWRRYYTPYLSSYISHTAANVVDALIHLIVVEDARAQRHSHGPDCGCEDCCIARVDAERLS